MSIKQTKFAPIVVFAYNRPWHLQQTIEALLKNSEATASDLFIFSDGPKNGSSVSAVNEVRAYIRKIDGFKSVTIVEREQNYGLGKSIIAGVSEVCGKFGKVIVLEDDLVTSPFFLKFMNDGLNYYEFEDKVISVHSYVFPVREPLPETFFLRGTGCLGWATWQRGWSLFEQDGQKLLDELVRLELEYEFNYNGCYPYTQMIKDQIAGKNSSWAVRWHASAFLQDKLTLHPGESLVKHIGNDGSGTNYGTDDFMGDRVSERSFEVGGVAIEHSAKVFKAYEQYLCANKRSYLVRLISRIKKVFS